MIISLQELFNGEVSSLRWSFVNGVLVGSIAGAVLGLMCYPQMKPSPQKYLIGKTRRIGKRTGRIMAGVAEDVQEMMKRN